MKFVLNDENLMMKHFYVAMIKFINSCIVECDSYNDQNKLKMLFMSKITNEDRILHMSELDKLYVRSSIQDYSLGISK